MSRAFAIVPAAGSSVRMGQPKLLLPLAGRPLILHVLDAWKASRVDYVAVVVRPDDTRLADLVRSGGTHVVIPPTAPPDMKSSVRFGLEFVARQFQPANDDWWLVAPADMPGLSPGVIDALLERTCEQPGTVLIPTLAGRRGHPVALPWPLAAEVERLGDNEGLDALVARSRMALIACDAIAGASDASFADVDTPVDYSRLH